MSEPTATKKYKWDIAISLCKQDIDFVRKLVKAINPSLKVFFYEDRQEELICKSGPLTIRKLLKHQFPVQIEPMKLIEYGYVRKEYYYHLRTFGFINQDAELYVDASDMGILKIFKIFSRIFGDLSQFEEHINSQTSEDATDFITLADYKGMLSFLLLQHHIAVSQGEEVFLRQIIQQHDRHPPYITDVQWPEGDFEEIDYYIQPVWNNGQPYKGDVSFFANGTVRIKATNFENDSFKVISVYRLIRSILHGFHEKGFFRKVGI